jgi:hypothetical protein
MSWKLIKSIQKKTDLRLIMPLGLNLKLGDVIAVGKDGTFTLEGSANSLLGSGLVKRRASQPAKINIYDVSGKKTQVQFRAAGTASAFFKGLPSASAGMDISFGSADEWVLAIWGRSLTSLDQIDAFRRPILDAYRWGVWKGDWALVTSIATVDKMTLLASRTRNTKVALSLSATVAPTGAPELKLTSGATIIATNAQITQCITTKPTVAFCAAIRVRDPWWSHPDIRTLAKGTVPRKPMTASYKNFWEDVDKLGS